MGKKVNISMLQMSSVIGDVEANISKIDTIIKQELPQNCDVLVLPEVWTCGWVCDKFIETAGNINNSSVINFLSTIAKNYNINIIGGSFIEERNGNYYNTCPIFDRNGKLVTTYSKNHLYSYYGCNEDKYISKGENPVMVCLDGINYGLTICYDIRFPEIYRAYRKSGADILVNCAAWGSNKPIPWEMMTKSRAIENQCYMVALTQCGRITDNEYNLGQSRIIDYKGEELCFIENKEGIGSVEISLDEMYQFRQKCTILNDIKDSYEVKILCEKY
ncbi:hypothetical protein J6N69_02590 [bacterium]|nr:hypothetical protein [bacterium]